MHNWYGTILFWHMIKYIQAWLSKLQTSACLDKTGAMLLTCTAVREVLLRLIHWIWKCKLKCRQESMHFAAVKTGRPSLSGVDIYMSCSVNKETTLYWRLTECYRDTQVLKYLW